MSQPKLGEDAHATSEHASDIADLSILAAHQDFFPKAACDLNGRVLTELTIRIGDPRSDAHSSAPWRRGDASKNIAPLW
jgi:hypothetical protein